ncbi:MAG TPA: hypothetical protein DDW52_28075 [Planctomycetaceae bacterium]|nr:hypothetical protein [Planctomycetaceae bacterium]
MVSIERNDRPGTPSGKSLALMSEEFLKVNYLIDCGSSDGSYAWYSRSLEVPKLTAEHLHGRLIWERIKQEAIERLIDNEKARLGIHEGHSLPDAATERITDRCQSFDLEVPEHRKVLGEQATPNGFKVLDFDPENEETAFVKVVEVRVQSLELDKLVQMQPRNTYFVDHEKVKSLSQRFAASFSNIFSRNQPESEIEDSDGALLTERFKELLAEVFSQRLDPSQIIPYWLVQLRVEIRVLSGKQIEPVIQVHSDTQLMSK